MCFGAVGDAFSAVDKFANSINPFKGITDWGTDNTLKKIPGIGKPLGQLADWGDSHPAEVGALIAGGWAAAPYLGAGATGEAAGAGAAEGASGAAAGGALGAGGSAAASSEMGAAATDVGVSGSGVAGASATAPGSAGQSSLAKYGLDAVKATAPAVVSSLLAPKPPKTKAPTAMPDPLAEQQAVQQKLLQQLARRGRASTILTSPGGAGDALGG